MAHRSPAPPSPPETTHAASPHDGGRRWIRDLLLVVLSVAVGLGGAYVLFGSDQPADPSLPLASTARGEGPAVSFDAAADGVEDIAEGEGTDAPVPTGAATSAQQAATAFLAAEAAGDPAAAYPHLAADDRERHDSPARWTAAHARFPSVTGFRLDGVTANDDGSTTVAADVRLASGLDPVLGLVPARAGLQLRTVEEDGRWAVDWSGSTLAARYPAEADAVAAARAWAVEAADCGEPVQYEAGLFGLRSLVDDLCAADGPVELGDVGELPADGGDRGLVSSFGADVVAWARVVPVTSPVGLDIVLAPVDDRWLVIGVLPTRTP